MSSWISVDEGMPEHTHDVLVVWCDDEPIVDIAYHDKRVNCWYLSSDSETVITVSHWMPLPELPDQEAV